MDLALARRSGQELHNHYVITNSPVMAHLHRFFRAAVRNLTAAYEGRAIASADEDFQPSICDQVRLEIAQGADDFDPFTDLASEYEIPEVESVSPLILSTATPPPVVDKPLRSITPINRSLAVLQSGPLVPPQRHMPLARGGCIQRVDRQYRLTVIRGAPIAGPTHMSYISFGTIMASRCAGRIISCCSPGFSGGSPECR